MNLLSIHSFCSLNWHHLVWERKTQCWSTTLAKGQSKQSDTPGTWRHAALRSGNYYLLTLLISDSPIYFTFFLNWFWMWLLCFWRLYVRVSSFCCSIQMKLKRAVEMALLTSTSNQTLTSIVNHPYLLCPVITNYYMRNANFLPWIGNHITIWQQYMHMRPILLQ